MKVQDLKTESKQIPKDKEKRTGRSQCISVEDPERSKTSVQGYNGKEEMTRDTPEIFVLPIGKIHKGHIDRLVDDRAVSLNLIYVAVVFNLVLGKSISSSVLLSEEESDGHQEERAHAKSFHQKPTHEQANK